APAGPDVSAPPADTAPPSPGFHPGSGARTGAVVALAPLGTLTPEMVAALPDGDVHLSAHRMLAVPAGDDPAALAARLAAAGFVTDPASPWTRVTACIGAPGCAKSAGDTRAAARALVAAGGAETAVHVVGCARSCGAPTRPHSLRVLTAPGPASSGGSRSSPAPPPSPRPRAATTTSPTARRSTSTPSPPSAPRPTSRRCRPMRRRWRCG